MRAALLLVALALAASLLGCAAGELPANFITTPTVPPAVAHDESEGDPHATLMRWNGDARAFPDSFVAPDRRLRAIEWLKTVRDSLGMPYISPKQMTLGAYLHGADADPGPLCQWHSLGPTNVNGRVTDIAIDPTNANQILVTTVGGVWRSLDAAETWLRVSDLNNMVAGVYSAVAMNPITPSEVFVAGGDANMNQLWRAGGPGIWRSETGGGAGSWTRMIGSALDGRVVYRIRVSRNSPYNVYLATDQGVIIGKRLAGTLASITWSPLGDKTWPATDIVLDDNSSPPVVYAGVGKLHGGEATDDAGIWRFASGSWSRKKSIAKENGGIVTLAISQGTPATIYAKVEDAANRKRASGSDWQDWFAIYRSTNGTSWNAVPMPGTKETTGYAYFMSALLVDPNNSNVLYVGGKWFQRYEFNVGWSPVPLAHNSDGSAWLHRDQHALAIATSGGTRWLYSCHDGGIDRIALNSSGALWPSSWHWLGCDHGLAITEFYDLAIQPGEAQTIVGGTQDNAAAATFGNRTWQYLADCDAGRVAVDPPIGSTIYKGCIDAVSVVGLAHPITITGMNSQFILWDPTPCLPPAPPVASDPKVFGAALAARWKDPTKEATPNPDRTTLLKLTNNTCWVDAGANLDPHAEILSVAIGSNASSPAPCYYVGFKLQNGSGGWDTNIWSSSDGGVNWNRPSNELPSGPSDENDTANMFEPVRITLDPTNPRHAYACYGGKAGGTVYYTDDAGATWTDIGPNFTSAAVMDLVVSPNNPNVLYVATEASVWVRDASSTWKPFDPGLPNGVDVSSIEVNPVTKHLIVGTLGYGAFEISLGDERECYRDRVVVRDNVFDRGIEPSPQGDANPLDPIVDTSRPAGAPSTTFYKHNDTNGALLGWWDSEDIRVTVPDFKSSSDAWISDPVTVESCPVTADFCPTGTIPDMNPVRRSHAEVYVQVHNFGTQTAHNIRVLAIWTNTDLVLPPLPNGFWTTTFAANASSCMTWPTSTSWHFFDDADCNSSFKKIAELAPDDSKVLTFDWDVPETAGDNCCVVAMVESDEDPLPSVVRTSNERFMTTLVPHHHQITQRNLHLLAPVMGAQSNLVLFGLSNHTSRPLPLRMIISRASLPSGFLTEIMFPSAIADSVDAISCAPVPIQLSPKDSLKAQDAQLHLQSGFRVIGKRGEIKGPTIPQGATWEFGLNLTPLSGASGPGRIRVVAVRDTTVLGGTTYVIQAGPP